MCFGKYLKNFSTRITCIRGESVIDCVDEQIPGDKVIIKCKSGYKVTNENSETERICLESGEWSGAAYECEAECGLSSSGIPWNAPVYKNKESICGGSLISGKILSLKQNYKHQINNKH